MDEAKEKFMDLLAKTYAEGYETGLQAGLKNCSAILNKLADTMDKGIDVTKAKAAVHANFIEVMNGSMAVNNPDPAKIIDFKDSKKK